MSIGDHTKGSGCKRSDADPIHDTCSHGGELRRAFRCPWQLLSQPEFGLRFRCASILSSPGTALATPAARQASKHSGIILNSSEELSGKSPNHRLSVARGHSRGSGSRSGRRSTLLWHGNASREQCRGPNLTGAPAPESCAEQRQRGEVPPWWKSNAATNGVASAEWQLHQVVCS